MRKNIFKKTLTLIELIVVIVILGLAIPVLMGLLTQANLNVLHSEFVGSANFYAEELMEEIILRRFDENESSPWSTSLGPDTSTLGIDGSTQENYTDHNNWDDVDDYNGYSDVPHKGYTRSVSVEYEQLNGTTWQAASSVPTDYKKITVSVSKTSGNMPAVRLVALVGGY